MSSCCPPDKVHQGCAFCLLHQLELRQLARGQMVFYGLPDHGADGIRWDGVQFSGEGVRPPLVRLALVLRRSRGQLHGLHVVIGQAKGGVGQCRQRDGACPRPSEPRRCPLPADCFEIACRAVDVKEADRGALERRALWFVPLDIRQTGDAVPLRATMQRRACQMRDRRLPGIEAVVQRQKTVPSKRDAGHLLGFCQIRGRGSFGLVLRSSTVARLRHLAPVFGLHPPQRRERNLRSLYCSSDGMRGRTVSGRSRDEPDPECFLPFPRKDRTSKPWDHTPRGRTPTPAIARPAARDESSPRRAIAQPAPAGANTNLAPVAAG